ncbi:hypothetical protein RKD54_003515 [Pseudarthrobacter sp. SLBN-100]
MNQSINHRTNHGTSQWGRDRGVDRGLKRLTHRPWLRWVPAVAVPSMIAAGVLAGTIPARAGDPLPAKTPGRSHRPSCLAQDAHVFGHYRTGLGAWPAGAAGNTTHLRPCISQRRGVTHGVP